MPKKLAKAIAYLSQYSDIKDEELLGMWEIMHFAQYPKNELLHRQGEISRNAAFILKGAIRAYYVDDKGVDHTLDF